MSAQKPVADAALNVAEKFHRTWIQGAVERALELVDPNVEVEYPGEHLMGIEEYGPFLSDLQPSVRGYDFITTFRDEKSSVLVYDLHMRWDSPAVICECLTVREAKITKIRLVFDANAFPPGTAHN